MAPKRSLIWWPHSTTKSRRCARAPSRSSPGWARRRGGQSPPWPNCFRTKIPLSGPPPPEPSRRSSQEPPPVRQRSKMPRLLGLIPLVLAGSVFKGFGEETQTVRLAAGSTAHGLVGYWPFDEGQGDTAANVMGHNGDLF